MKQNLPKHAERYKKICSELDIVDALDFYLINLVYCYEQSKTSIIQI